MPTEDTMTIDERHGCLRIQQERYRNATRRERGALLDYTELIGALKRKALIRLMDVDLNRNLRCKQRKGTYGDTVPTWMRC